MKPRKPTKGKSECDLCPLVVFGSHSSEVSLFSDLLRNTKSHNVVLIMHYDFIFSFYYYFRGVGWDVYC